MTKQNKKRWPLILAAVFAVLVLVFGLKIWQIKYHPQKENRPTIGIAWCDIAQNYAQQAAVIEEAGGNVVELDKIAAPGLTYNFLGELDSKWLGAGEELTSEAAEIVKSVSYSDTNLEAALEGIDAVVFFGGADISPALYKNPQEVANMGEVFSPTRDVSDYILMSYCIENDIPMLCICRGMQMICVVSGCDIEQDLPTYYSSLGLEYNDYHRITNAKQGQFAHHDIDITVEDSLMHNIVGKDVLRNVSSWHHQGIVSTEGTNFTVTAAADIGGVNLVEAVELQKNTFCLGLQFHPEIDCSNVINEGVSKESVCDYDACLGFFKALVECASKQAC